MFATIPAVVVLVAATLILNALERKNVIATQRVDDLVALPPVRLVQQETTPDGEVYRIGDRMMIATRVPVEKSLEAFRIVVSGGSFAMGIPYHGDFTARTAAGTIPAWMAAELSMRCPGRRIEMINAAAMSQTSTRVRAIVDELLTLEPDLVIVLAGNNEGQQHATALNRALHRWVVYRELKTVLKPPAPPEERPYFTPQSDDLLGTRERFFENVDGMIAAAKAAGVPIAVGTLPINGYYTPDDRTLYESYPPMAPEVAGALAACRAGRFDEGITALADARDAGWTLRALAECYELKGDFEAARRYDDLYVEQMPFNRIRPSYNDELRERVPGSGAILADLDRAARALSPQGIAPSELFVDYCHMRYEGYFEMSRTLIDALARAGALPPMTLPAPTRDAILDAKGWRDTLAQSPPPYQPSPDWPAVVAALGAHP
ncbi:MAG: tetratricopeptide repeat protein [Deltaproteobacteria bacterium]|nr:tetratricopeptide repeat protein [Deltaproteobacteria bacterium]